MNMGWSFGSKLIQSPQQCKQEKGNQDSVQKSQWPIGYTPSEVSKILNEDKKKRN